VTYPLSLIDPGARDFGTIPSICEGLDWSSEMDIHQLELFLAVMDSPSMTRAAERIHLSPGAVSLQLHNLAEELHTELFVRRGKRLIPTPAALRLAEHAKQVVRMMGQIQQMFETDLEKDVRPFHFATGVTTLIYQLGSPLRQLRKRFPNAQIRVTVGVTEEMVAGLLDRRFDLALISLPVSESKLKLIPLFDEELLIVRPSANNTASGHIGSLRASELADVPFLLYPRKSNVRLVIERFFAEIGVTPRVLMEADDTEAIKRLVESGFGYSILPEHALRGSSHFFQKFRVVGHRLTRSLALATAQTDCPRKLTDSIANFLRDTLVEGRSNGSKAAAEAR
jgi:DNA-binding transcriptional LysR family regulator